MHIKKVDKQLAFPLLSSLYLSLSSIGLDIPLRPFVVCGDLKEAVYFTFLDDLVPQSMDSFFRLHDLRRCIHGSVPCSV